MRTWHLSLIHTRVWEPVTLRIRSYKPDTKYGYSEGRLGKSNAPNCSSLNFAWPLNSLLGRFIAQVISHHRLLAFLMWWDFTGNAKSFCQKHHQSVLKKPGLDSLLAEWLCGQLELGSPWTQGSAVGWVVPVNSSSRRRTENTECNLIWHTVSTLTRPRSDSCEDHITSLSTEGHPSPTTATGSVCGKTY